MTATWSVLADQAAGAVVTAARLNAIRDNTEWLKTPPQTVLNPAANVTITSTSFVDLFTGLSITTVGGRVMVAAVLTCSHTVGGAPSYFDVEVDGVSESSGNGVLIVFTPGAGYFFNASIVWVTAALSAAAHTIKLKAKVGSGTLTAYGVSGLVKSQIYVREV